MTRAMVLVEVDGGVVRLSVRQTIGGRRTAVVRSALTLGDGDWSLLDADEQPFATDADAIAALKYVATGAVP